MMADIPEIGPSTPVVPARPPAKGESKAPDKAAAKRRKPNKSPPTDPDLPTHIDEYV